MGIWLRVSVLQAIALILAGEKANDREAVEAEGHGDLGSAVHRHGHWHRRSGATALPTIVRLDQGRRGPRAA